jgi:hypothetical protein
MAKRVAKRITNAQRRAREKERRATVLAAYQVAMIIELEIEKLRAGRGDKPRGTRLNFGSSEEFCDGEERVFINFGERAYNAIGRLLCEYHENPPKFLRMVADLLEEKELYSPGDNWYDGAIEAAYNEVWRRCIPSRPTVKFTLPSFSEFEKVFREQNPKLQGASDRSLRRSLQRLGCLTSPDKRGRPKEK